MVTQSGCDGVAAKIPLWELYYHDTLQIPKVLDRIRHSTASTRPSDWVIEEGNMPGGEGPEYAVRFQLVREEGRYDTVLVRADHSSRV